MKKMRRNRKVTSCNSDRGVVITLVAVFMLFVMGAMAALSIDVVALYTARSEAQLAADAGALAGARVLANSGATSDPNLLLMETSSGGSASVVAIEVATQNDVGGTPATATVSFDTVSVRNPKVTVQVSTNTLPTFFSRIWGTTQLSVTARAKAEAYNPTPDGSAVVLPPTATICVKPWVLPNMDPRDPTGNTTIFNPASGAVTTPNPSLVNFRSTGSNPRMSTVCPPGSSCATTGPATLKYYPLDLSTFPAPSSVPECSPALITPYQQGIAGCIPVPISCNDQVPLDLNRYDTRDSEATDAINCLTHANRNGGDTIGSSPPAAPFVFVGGSGNPIPGTDDKDLMVSDSLVTVPVYDNTAGGPPTSTVQIVGFVRLFLNFLGRPTPTTGPNTYHTRIAIIDLIGCGGGIGARSGTPILGNGSSPIAVRLISPN